ncbi:class I SAM-dependent methyltransferase [Candidatus Halobeggiatoa sp. HSG11]|nr:class I SAM-dependent methyltransferase [Candidatus Halobeggiatoa sp. HSG11]
MSHTAKNYANLDFPLNVFAYCLCVQEGKVNYLHYGLFAENESIQDAKIAQQRSTNFLLDKLPKPPCRILEIGVGLGTTASQLAKLGYAVTGISPDAKQISLAKHNASDKVKLECTTLQEFIAPPDSFEVILLQESAQYLEVLALFNKAHKLLTQDGLVFIIDEIALKRTETDTPHELPLVDHTIAQAQRCGFKLTEQIDLSKQAMPSVDYLLWVIDKYRTNILADLNLTTSVLDELQTSLQQYQQKYRNGYYGYIFLQLTKTRTPRWQVTLVTEQDSVAVRDLFDEVFKPETMSPEFWNWKYGDGKGLCVAAWRNDKMVGHFGGIKKEICYFGLPKFTVQLADVMVSTTERAILTKRSALFLIETTFLENNIGYGANTWIGYGFPNDAHLKLAKRLGLLGVHDAIGRKIVELSWSTTTGRPSLWTRIRHLQPSQPEQNKLIINKLWQQMQANLTHAIVGIHNWEHIYYRYLLHPHHKYELLLVTRRLTGQAIGVAVICRQDDICHIRDFIGNPKYVFEVVQQVQRIAGNWGMKQVKAWITDNFINCFPNSEEVKDMAYIPHNTWSKYLPSETEEGHWWLMSGDTDFL